MASGSSIVVPMVLWGRHAPTHCISAILMTPDMKHVITGCNDGQICIWDVLDNWQVCPRSLLFGHSAAISCLANGSNQPDQQYIVSSSENGEMCLWDISDGRCIEHTKMAAIHTDMMAYNFRSRENKLSLLCNGYYPEVLVLDPHSFEIIHTLCSKVAPDWISACCHIQPPNRKDDVILAISNSGAVKVWTISGNEGKIKLEDESKQIRSLNAQTLTCCPFNQRTVLIVCAKYWQVYNFEQLCGRTVHGIYDASDFTLLCSESNRCGERWAGGHFLSVDRVIVWSTEGRGYLYKLPTNANPESSDYHRSHHQTTVHAYYVLDIYNNQSPACFPALTFFHGKSDKPGGFLLRGDSEGRIVIWQVPEVSEKQMTLVRQESFDRLPALMPKLCTTLQDLWNMQNGFSPGILDGLSIFDDSGDEYRPSTDTDSSSETTTSDSLQQLDSPSGSDIVPVREETDGRLHQRLPTHGCQPAFAVAVPRTVTQVTRVHELFEMRVQLSGMSFLNPFDRLCDEKDGPLKITSTIYIPAQGKLVVGRENGSIVIVPAVCCIMKQLLWGGSHNQDIPLKMLQGHEGRVTCLLYPFSDCTRYEPHHLLSGGQDFSVILWDINTGSRIHTFTVHGGMLEQLIVPPANCNPRILSSVCSVASDHSVALLSLKERKCVMLAGRHLFPVKSIRWRPLDDFMVVSCTDGTVYVWQMETGHLDRVVHGITAEEIVNNCDENALPKETLTNPSLTLAQALKRRNLATFRNLAQQKLQQNTAQQACAQGPKAEFIKPTGFPLLVQGVRTNTKDPDAHVLFFDTESLIVQLLSEEFSLLSPGELEARGLLAAPPADRRGANLEEGTDTQQKIVGLIAKAKETAETMSQKLQSKMDQTALSPPMTAMSNVSKTSGDGSSVRLSQPPKHFAMDMVSQDSMIMEIAQLFMSCLHAWGLDPDLDRLCVNKLGLLRPRCPISFGLLSYQGHMSLMLPGWHGGISKISAGTLHNNLERVNQTGIADPVLDPMLPTGHKNSKTDLTQQPKVTLIVQRMASVQCDDNVYSTDDTDSESDTAKTKQVVLKSDPNPESRPAPNLKGTKAYSFGTSIEACEYSTKVRWQMSSAITTQHLLSVISIANTLMSMSRASFLLLQHQSRRKQDMRAVATRLNAGEVSDVYSEDDGSDAATVAQAQVKQGWSLLAALHCVLLPELIGTQHYRSPQLEMLARRWQDRCLEIREAAQALLLAELRRIGAIGRKVVIDEWSPYLPTRVDPKISILSEGGKEEEEDEEEMDQILGGDLLSKTSVSLVNRRRQATAIVMLGVIGAEFGQEIEPNRRKVEEGKKEKLRKNEDGFNMSNYSLARQTSRALTFLLLSPPSNRLPAYTPIRRAAMDLLGRGFTVWEPYLDISSVLMGLLDLCVDAERRVPSVMYGLPLSPASDACRTARHALSLIATARPPAFIITLAKEVARYNAMAQNAQSQHTQMHNMALVRAAPEILHVIEMLVDKMPNDVADLIIEVMDITMHCLDLNQLKARGLQELFPAICRFSMVSFCNHTKRIWVGAKSGALALYEMKQHTKCQLIQAHHGPVIAVAVSPDGKYLATFSHLDQRLKFFQTASSSIFSIGSQQTKCVRQYTTKEINVTPLTNILKLVRLVWIDNRTVVMLTVDGSETKYSV